MARSRDIWGPYETQPDGHLLCAADAPDHPIQRTGHGQIVETHWGETYHTFLMGRPLPGRFCPMGRETGIERCVWGDDDWLYLQAGGRLARLEVPSPTDAMPAPETASRDVFDGSRLPDAFQWLRTPEPSRIFALGALAVGLNRRLWRGGKSISSIVPKRGLNLRLKPISRRRG